MQLNGHRLSMLRGTPDAVTGSYGRRNETSTLFASLYTILYIVPETLQIGEHLSQLKQHLKGRYKHLYAQFIAAKGLTLEFWIMKLTYT